MIIIVMGVAGSGKTTIGRLLAESTGFHFVDADSLHSPENIAKMRGGTPLTDSDRAPWLSAIRDRIVDATNRQEDLVLACSALKEDYRSSLTRGVPVIWAYLKADADTLRRRLEQRTGHFMPAQLLNSQLDSLEEPADAIVLDASRPPRAIAGDILARLRA